MDNISTVLTDSEIATLAATWCERNRIDYDLEYWGWPRHTKYKFIFTNQQDLVLFSLKWT